MNNKDKIIFVGAGKVASGKIVQSLKNDDINIVVINTEQNDEALELNGVKYKRIEKQNNNNPAISKSKSLLALLTHSLCAEYSFGDTYIRSLSKNIDIIKEYALIQNKKSNLSCWERRKVVEVFEKNFYKID